MYIAEGACTEASLYVAGEAYTEAPLYIAGGARIQASYARDHASLEELQERTSLEEIARAYIALSSLHGSTTLGELT